MNDVCRTELKSTEYNLEDVPRCNRSGGSVGILYRKNLKVKTVKNNRKLSFEHGLWKITCKNKSVYLAVIYCPSYSRSYPVTTTKFFEEFSEFLTEVCTNEEIVFAGDFNIPMNRNGDTDTRKLMELLDDFNLQQHITFPTHISNNTIDLVITKREKLN